MDANYHQVITDLVPNGSKVLDLGCGDGSLLSFLTSKRNCTGYGVENNDANVLACAQKGVSVLQLNLEQGLSIFQDKSFDVVLQIDSFQNLRNAETMLKETVRVGKIGIIAFPNFAYWPNRLSVLGGRMPVTERLPYEWYDTPNIRVGTFADMAILVPRLGIEVVDAFGLTGHKVIRHFPNSRAPTAVFCIAGR